MSQSCSTPEIAGRATTATIPGRDTASWHRSTGVTLLALGLAWAFQSNQIAAIKASPLMVDGVVYLTVPNNVWAVDARTGHLLWKYTYPANHGHSIGHRGVGMYKGTILFLSPDCHLVALDAKEWEGALGHRCRRLN